MFKSMIGIESIAFSTSKYFLDMGDLAFARHQDREKYYKGIMQEKMAVIPPCEDSVTLGYSAAKKVLKNIDKSEIKLSIFATESGVDESKSGGVYFHKFLELPDDCRTFEVKQACYGGTAALFIVYDFVRANPDKKALVVMSDVARYGLESVGESTQGGGAAALVISCNPKIAIVNSKTAVFSKEIMDFWRPVGYDHALVNGALSSKRYLESLKKCYDSFVEKNDISLDFICYHVPFCKMALKGHSLLFGNVPFEKAAIAYNKFIGNCYTASLYISLISLLDNSENLENKNIGMYSYGSGSVAELFSLKIVSEYKQYLDKTENQNFIENRIRLSVREYEDMYNAWGQKDIEYDVFQTSGDLYLSGIINNIREYKMRKTEL